MYPKTIGKLTILRRGSPVPRKSHFDRGLNRGWMVLCRCECGTEKWILEEHVKNGHTRSCGCVRKQTSSERRYKHGDTVAGKGSGKRKCSVEYNTWSGMKERCYNAASKYYKYYGGRGIELCPRWLESFNNFLADMGRRPSPKHSIDRIDNDGNYEPGNCHWATRLEQAANKRSTRKLTLNGETHHLRDWSSVTGIKRATISNRLFSGWTVEEALTTPVGGSRRTPA